MAKRIRFTSPAANYRSGDIAQFHDDAEADGFIERGSAVPHSGDADAPDDRPASDVAIRPEGPVNVQGRVEAHDIPPSRSSVLSVVVNGDEPKTPAPQRVEAPKVDKL